MITKIGKRTLLIALSIIHFSLSISVAQIESRLSYRRYTTQDGLPQMQTERVWQDSHGYIYIGTLSGFVRFDGKGFASFLKGRRFNIVGFAETEGTVRAFDFRRQWLTGFDEVEMVPIDPQGQWLLNNFNSGSLPDGYVLLENEQEANRRICRVGEGRFLPVVKGALLDRMTPDRKLYLDSASVYVPTEDGLFMVPRGTGMAMRISPKNDVFTLLRTNGRLLAFAADGIYTVDRKSLWQKTAFDFKATNYGLIVRPLANGHLMIADEHTLYEYDGNKVREMATGFNLIKDMLVDKWDRLWLATYEGLYCFFNRCFTNHRLTDRDDIVRAIGVDGRDQMVLGTLNGKLILWGKENRSLAEDYPDNYYGPNAVTIDGRVYMAGNGDVACYDGTQRWLGLPHDRYQFVAQAGRRLIIGSRKCITAYDPVTGAADTLTTEVPYPWCAAEDSQGRLWVGTTFGLYADGKKVDYQQKLIVTTMERDSQGNIVLASKDSLFLIRDGQVTPLTMPGLTGHEVRSLHLSQRGYLTVAAIDGLFVCRIDKDYQLSDIRFFDHTNGFTALEPLMATMAETADGTVWLAGVEEMTSFRPEALLAYRQEDTYIAPPLRWWQQWWVLFTVVLLLSAAVWMVTRWYEKRRARKDMIRLQREKLQKEHQIEAIRQKAQEDSSSAVARDIVKMTEKVTGDKLSLRTVSGMIAVDTDDIACFKGDGNYSQIVTFHSTETVLVSLRKLEKTLDSKVFVRADRSTIVNIHNIYRLDVKQRRCIFKSANGVVVETSLLVPAFKRLEAFL